MLVTVDTDHLDLVHNTEVLEAALNELPTGWVSITGKAGGIHKRLSMSCILTMTVHSMSQMLSSMTGRTSPSGCTISCWRSTLGID